MNEKSYKNWLSMSDDALTQQLGAFVKHHRLDQNKTQDKVAKAAGISRSTLSLLERGDTVSLSTFIQVLRVLDQLQVMDAFEIQQSISPIALAKAEREKRKRARSTNYKNEEKPTW
jgi:transcriptional regulator with XRE-family HTH domain